MAEDQAEPIPEKPSPTNLGLIIGAPVGLGIVSAPAIERAASRAGAGGLAAWLISVVAAVLIAWATAAVVVWLMRRRD